MISAVWCCGEVDSQSGSDATLTSTGLENSISISNSKDSVFGAVFMAQLLCSFDEFRIVPSGPPSLGSSKLGH